MQTSYSVDRAGTAEQEAEAAEEALLTDAPEGSGPPKRVRRTREQIEQEKIEKAQQRIEAIKREQRLRKMAIACGKVEEAMHLLAGSGCCVELPSDDGTDSDHETFNVLLAIRTALSLELGK
jgi:hypothetical protein